MAISPQYNSSKLLDEIEMSQLETLLLDCLNEPSLDMALGRFYSNDLVLEIDPYNKGGELTLLEFMIAKLNYVVNYNYFVSGLESALRIYFCYFNKSWFAYYYFNHDHAPCQEKWRKNFDRKRHFQAAPRDHGKSTIYSFELILWKICYVDNIRILTSSKVDTLAQKYLGAIKRTIETNEKIKADFGDLTENVNPVDGSLLDGGKGKGGWSKNVFFCRRTNHTLKDGTLECIGWGSAAVGSRFDLIVLDDPIEKSDCTKKTKRDNMIEGLHQMEELLEPEGQILVVGTRKHRKDLYNYLIENPRWTYTIDSGIIKFPDHYEYVFVEDPETGKKVVEDVIIPEGETWKVLWEEKWSIKQLLIKKYGTTHKLFMSETQNEIQDNESSDFPMDWLNNCTDLNQLNRRIPFYTSRPSWAKWVVAGCDLAGVFNKEDAEKNDNDFMVIPVLAVDYENKRHLIYAFRDRGMDADEQLFHMKRIYHDFEVEMMVLETNAYQKAMHGLALKRGLKRIMPHNTGGEKHSIDEGIPALSMDIKAESFIFYSGNGSTRKFYDDLIAEFFDYGVTDHDDIVMSIWLANLGVNWLLTREYKQKEKANRKMDKKTKAKIKRVENESFDKKNIEYETKPKPDPELAEADRLLNEYIEKIKQESG